MTNSQEIKQKLGENTELLEKKVKELSPYYTNLEPWQRGTLILILTFLLLIATYQLLKKPTLIPKELTETERKKIEALAEERILKRAEFLRKLRE